MIMKSEEEIFIQSILEAEDDVKRGRVFTGDLDKLAENLLYVGNHDGVYR
jgi:hypothetical protein